MVINLCRNSEAINTIVKKSYAKEKILDITGVINEFSTNQLRLSSIDKDGKLEVLAVKNYVSFIGNLSRASVDHVPLRDFRILGEPLFWFTPIAEKHDSFHWGKDVWLLYTLLIE
ncbi:MAG TPA: hypothetical protein PLS50_07250 [Candidatus Dojkabacteria bacterium]|nr:hypothetical protein [Candidatus Dojkabacteria bacterium]